MDMTVRNMIKTTGTRVFEKRFIIKEANTDEVLAEYSAKENKTVPEKYWLSEVNMWDIAQNGTVVLYIRS